LVQYVPIQAIVFLKISAELSCEFANALFIGWKWLYGVLLQKIYGFISLLDSDVVSFLSPMMRNSGTGCLFMMPFFDVSRGGRNNSGCCERTHPYARAMQ